MEEKCKHRWGALGFQKINATDTKVEVIAAVFCKLCGSFRTKILYYDRQHDIKEKQNES